MAKKLYLIGIIFSFIFFFISGFYFSDANDVRDAINQHYIDSISEGGVSDPYIGTSIGDVSFEIGMRLLFFLALFVIVDLVGLMKVKTKGMKSRAIIGLCLSGVIFLWNLLMISSPDAISYDEVGIAWIFYGLVIFILMIVGYAQSRKYYKNLKDGVPVEKGSEDLLDTTDS